MISIAGENSGLGASRSWDVSRGVDFQGILATVVLFQFHLLEDADFQNHFNTICGGNQLRMIPSTR